MNKKDQNGVGSALGVVPSVSVQYAQTGVSTKANALGMRPMQGRIYIGRRFKNDTERLEKLFDLYTRMTAATFAKSKGRKR